jgi:hypothetical protein
MKIFSGRIIRGQSTIELALLLPVLLLLSVGTLDLGRAIFAYSVVYNASREGARYAIVHQCSLDKTCSGVVQDASGIEATARKLAIGLKQSNLNMDPPVFYDLEKTQIKVSISYEFHFLTPFIKNLINECGCIQFHSSSIMFVER